MAPNPALHRNELIIFSDYQIGTLSLVFIENDAAEYYFEQTGNGQLLLFPVEFVVENGVWKILEF